MVSKVSEGTTVLLIPRQINTFKTKIKIFFSSDFCTLLTEFYLLLTSDLVCPTTCQCDVNFTSRTSLHFTYKEIFTSRFQFPILSGPRLRLRSAVGLVGIERPSVDIATGFKKNIDGFQMSRLNGQMECSDSTHISCCHGCLDISTGGY